MVSKNKHLCTVYSLPWQRTREKLTHGARLFFALFSFKNIIMKSAMDWRADFRNCTKSESQLTTEQAMLSGFIKIHPKFWHFEYCIKTANFLVN